MTFWINITFPHTNFHSIDEEKLRIYQVIALNIQRELFATFRVKKIKVKRISNFTVAFSNFTNSYYLDPKSYQGSTAWGVNRYVDLKELNIQNCASMIFKEVREVLHILASQNNLPENYFDECIDSAINCLHR